VLREAIDRILELAAPKTIEVGAHVYSAGRGGTLYVVPAPQPNPLTFSSLTAVRDYLLSGFDEGVKFRFALHVASPAQVNIVNEIDIDDMSRGVMAVATPDLVSFPFGQFQSHEQFTIGLQTGFVADANRAALLQRTGNLTADEIRTSLDDGVTQTVTAKAGVALTDRIELPSPVTLRPYRTFHEVEQPASPFILRARKNRDGSGVELALFEADGGAWRNVARDSVATWLRGAIGENARVVGVFA
jgi:hypothetical protein